MRQFSQAQSSQLAPEKQLKPRLIQLDILRGIAIFLVLLNHTPQSPQNAGFFSPLAILLHRFGWTGVDLFFVLSGFLIGGLLFAEILRTETLDLPRFLIRRIFKIWPSYFLVVLAGFGITLARTHGNAISALKIMLPNIFHIQNYIPGDRPIGQTWSLAVEEHFYLALPLFLWLLFCLSVKGKKSLVGVPVASAMIILFCLVYRIIVNGHRPFEPYTHLFPTHIRMDSLCFGVLLAYLYHFAPSVWVRIIRYRIWLTLVGAAMLVPMMALERETSPFVWTIGYTMLFIGYGCFLLLAVNSSQDVKFTSKCATQTVPRFIAWVGSYSYTIYLWFGIVAGKPIEFVCERLTHLPTTLLWSLSTLVYLALAIAGGVFAGRLIDRPALTLRERFFPSRTSALH